MTLVLQPLEKVFASLNKALQRALANPNDEELRDATIQRFEYTFELSWKQLKRRLETDEGGSGEIDMLK